MLNASPTYGEVRAAFEGHPILKINSTQEQEIRKLLNNLMFVASAKKENSIEAEDLTSDQREYLRQEGYSLEWIGYSKYEDGTQCDRWKVFL
jgi:conjugal transfer/entry exclusion protein